jgi:hypothetical protein
MVIVGPCPEETLSVCHELDNPGTSESVDLSLKNCPFLETDTGLLGKWRTSQPWKTSVQGTHIGILCPIALSAPVLSKPKPSSWASFLIGSISPARHGAKYITGLFLAFCCGHYKWTNQGEASPLGITSRLGSKTINTDGCCECLRRAGLLQASFCLFFPYLAFPGPDLMLPLKSQLYIFDFRDHAKFLKPKSQLCLVKWRSECLQFLWRFRDWDRDVTRPVCQLDHCRRPLKV